MVKPRRSFHTSIDTKSYEYLLELNELHNFKYINQSIIYLINQHRDYNFIMRKDILKAVIDQVLKMYFEDKNGKTKR